jgi:hypothetical protein
MRLPAPHMAAATSMLDVCYWTGFQWGVCRAFHGENFSTPELHQWRMELTSVPDPLHAEAGRGYRDGLALKR